MEILIMNFREHEFETEFEVITTSALWNACKELTGCPKEYKGKNHCGEERNCTECWFFALLEREGKKVERISKNR